MIPPKISNAFLSLLSLLLLTIYTLSVNCDEIIFSSFDRVNNTFVLNFGGEETDKTIIFMPHVNELIDPTNNALRLINIHEIHPHNGVCIGISISDDFELDGCAGDVLACVKSDKLFHCIDRISTEGNVRLFESYKTVKLFVYSADSSKNSAVSFVVDAETSPLKESKCPVVDFSYVASDNSFCICVKTTTTTTTMATTATVFVYIENLPFVRTAQWSFDDKLCMCDINLNDISRSYSHLNRLIVSIPDINCLMHFDIENDLLRMNPNWNQMVQSLAFDVNFKVSMRPPVLQATLSLPEITPQVDFQNIMFFYSLYQDHAILVSSTSIRAPDNMALLDMTACDKHYYVLLQVMYIDGSLLLSRKKSFAPDMFCARYNMSSGCFCKKKALSSTLMKTTTRPQDTVTVAATATISEIPFASNAYSPVEITTTTATNTSTNCFAIDLDNGDTIYPDAVVTNEDDGQTTTDCVYKLKGVAGHYRITHGHTVFENVIVCKRKIPSAEYVTSAEDSISYIKIDTGIKCPMPDHFGNVYKSTYNVSLTINGNNNNDDVQCDDNTNTCYVWFPQLSHYDIDINYPDIGQTESLAIDVTKDLSLTPIYCKSKHATMQYNHLPRFKTDHSAFAEIKLVDKHDSYVYALQIIKNSVIGEWLQIRKTVTSIQLESGAHYRFTVMVQERNVADSILVTNVCYDPLGQIKPLPEIVINVVSPIDVIECDGLNFVIFKVTTNFPHELKGIVPFAHNEDIPIDIYSVSDFIYVAGPLDVSGNNNNNYKQGSMTIEFKFGTQGQIVVTALDDILSNGLYTTKSHMLSTNEYGYDYKTSKILANSCKPRVIVDANGGANKPDSCVNLTSHFELISDDYKDWRQHDTICSGKRLFRIVFDQSSRYLSYKTELDPDMGSVVVTDGAVFAIAVKRQIPIRVDTYYNPWSSNYMGVKIPSCTSTIDLPTQTQLVWSFNMPTIRVVSSYESSCMVTKDGKPKSLAFMSRNKPQQAEIGGFILKITDPVGNIASSVQKYTLAVESATDHIPVVARTKNPWMPIMDSSTGFKGSLIYSGLDSGAFVAKLSVTDFLINSTGYTCHSRELLFVEPTTKAFELEDVVDFSQTSVGSKNTLCPKDMYADDNSWLEYYTLTLNSDFINTNADNKDLMLAVKIWEKTTSSLVKTAHLITPSRVESVIRYRLPRPGSYIAELILADTKKNTQCSHHLPEYNVVDPQFDRSSFVAEVITYPTCADSSDGLIKISYPEHLTDVIASVVSCSLYFKPSVTCARDIVVDDGQSAKGAIFIRNAPYMLKLSLSFEIFSACMFTADFTIVPESGSAYVLTGIRYMPTCKSRFHMFMPQFYGISDDSEDFGVTRAEWVTTGTDGSTVLSTDLSFVFDPAVWLDSSNKMDDKTMELTVAYNGGQCSTKFSSNTDEFIPNMYITPEVAIDPILFEFDKSRSLPVYCPYSSDAMLVATVYPQLKDKSDARNRLNWLVDNAANLTLSSSAIIDKTTVAAVNIEGGKTYQLTYTSGPCTATDSVTVPEKRQFNILNHLVVEPARCSGLTARAYLDNDNNDVHTGCSESEVLVFTSDMILSTKDRIYIDDHGAGATSFDNVPDGSVIRMKMPYDSKYKSAKPFCDALLEIDFGKVAPNPVKAYVQNIDEPFPLKLYTPPWITTTNKNTCTQETITLIESDWFFELTPLTQTMECPYSQPQPISVYKVFNKTGDRFFVKRYADPLSFFSDLTSMDASFTLTFPSHVEISVTSDLFVIDAHCNLEQYMLVAITFTDEAKEGLRSIDKNNVMIDGIKVPCYYDPTSMLNLVCRIPRKVGFYMQIAYLSTTGGSCFVTIPIHYVVSDLQYFIPDVSVSNDNETTNATVTACLKKYHHSAFLDTTASEFFRCFEVDNGFGVYNISSTPDDRNCNYNYEVVVNKDNNDEDDDSSRAVQIVFPSCEGSSDGAIVWKLPNDTVVTHSNLAAGLHVIEYEDTNQTTVVYDGIYLWPSEPVSYIVQPSDFPAPPYKKNAADVIGLPYSMSDPLDIMIYIRGGSELLDIVIVGVKSNDGSQIYPECVLRYYENVYWTYVCNSTLVPGYSYTFDVDCLHRQRQQRLRRPSVITTLEKLALSVTQLNQPTTLISKDGGFGLEISGGVPPFTVIFENSDFSTKQTSRYIISNPATQSSSGVYHLTIIDSTGSIITQDINLFPKVSTAIESINIGFQTGCGLSTETRLQVRLSNGANADSIGAWNQVNHESPILTCSDSRMIEQVGGNNDDKMDIIVGESGDWLVAICYQKEIVAVSENPIAVPMQNVPFSVDVSNGGSMTYCPDGSLISTPVLTITPCIGSMTVRSVGGAYNVVITRCTPYVFGLMDAGIYSFEVADDSLCFVTFNIWSKMLQPHDHECQS